ncbi:MAG: DUF3467 domain-containing protein [Candidatus Eisenbacteria bacterium]|uniref:DUF3467 domain-containing protein n=1 Tax=Eiseniibacteriota bacterium TaxID=2212470 RepID=A0A7Y2H2N2_UNCEI|nr:DUF3467 domain-containing protein [Candidatus Eisenbacteria bacterium]
MTENKAPAPRQGNIQIEIGEAEGQGQYSNLALITHSNAEIVVDFARVLPGLKKAKVYSRILLTPFHAKALHRALGDNLEKFEKQHGVIKTPGPDESSKIGF